MITFKQYLTELFDKPLPYEKEEDTGYMSSYIFRVPNKNLGFHRVHITNMKSEPTAYVAFLDNNKNENVTGNYRNNSHRVFSTVKKIVQDHVANHPHITHVTFSGSNQDGHARFYSKMMGRESNPSEVKSGNMYNTFRIKVR